MIGAASEFKEGDFTIGVGAKDEATRKNARALLSKHKIKRSYQHPLSRRRPAEADLADHRQDQYERIEDWTMGRLKEFLLNGLKGQ